MDALTMYLIGAGLGLLKNELVDKPREQEEQERADKIRRWSAWTGLKAEPVTRASAFNNMMQGAMTGGMFNQSLENAETNKKISELQGGLLNAKTDLAKAQTASLLNNPHMPRKFQSSTYDDFNEPQTFDKYLYEKLQS